MKRTVFAFVLLTFLGISHSMLLAQTASTTTCPVTIQMQDSYGDGWNGNSLLLYHGDSLIANITLNSGSSGEEIVSMPADSIRMYWNRGSYVNECSFIVKSVDGEILYTSPSGMGDFSNVFFGTFVNTCPSCLRPSNLHLISRTIDQLVIGWNSDSTTTYIVEYGPYGFTRGTGTFFTTTSDTLSITGLSPNIAQTVYVARLCDNGDTSRWAYSSFVTLCDSSACSYTVRLVDNYNGYHFGGQLLICHESGAVIDTVHYPSDYYSSYYEREVSLCPGVLKLKYEPNANSLDYYSLQYQYMIVKDAEGDTVSFSNAYNAYYNANGFYDSITYHCPTCLAVQGVTPTIIDSTTVSLSWRSTNAQQYLVSYKQNNGSLYDTITISDTTITLTGLQTATQYDVQIRGLCEGGDTSKIRSAHFATGPRWYGKVYVSQTATADTLDGHSWATAVSSIAEAQQIAVGQAIYGNYPDIWVAEGTYYGQNTIYPSQNVYGGFAGTEAVDFDLSQRDLTAHATILDGQNYNYRVLYQNTDFTDSTRVLWDGFIIQKGYRGAYLRGYSMLRNCIVRDNRGSYSGVGVYVYNTTGTRTVSIENCKILNNISYADNGYSGGGIYARYTYVDNSFIAENEAYSGGGVYLYGSSLRHCDIVNNRAYYGSGICKASSTYDTIINSIIWNNRYAVGDSLPTQIYADYSNYLAISRSATTDSVTGSGNVRISNSNWGHASGTNYVNFVNPEQGDYRLNPGSACIDAAYSISGFSNKDLAGNNRIYGDAPDMGCYENEGDLTCGTPFNLVLVNRTDTSATLQWDASSATSYTLQYATAENDNWTTVSSITNNQYTLSGLQEYTKYKVRVSSICTAGTSSDYSDTFFFNSQCLNPIEPVSIGGFDYAVNYLPIRTSYPYSTSHFLVKSSEMDNLGRTIDTIGFRFNSSSTERDIIIKIHQTTTNDLSWSNLYSDSVNGQTVFQGRVSFVSGGWTKIPLQYSYQTTGTSNLVISVFDTTGTGGDNGSFYCNTPDHTTLYTYGYGPGNMYGNYTTSYRPNIYLSGGCDMSSCHTPRMSVANVTDSSVTINGSRLDGTQQVEIRLLGETDFISANNIEWQDSIVTLSALLSNRTYEIRLRNICSDGDTSEWYTTEFTTLPMNLSRIYVKANATGNNDGGCWTNAFTDLNNALQVAARCIDIYGTHPDIWVATGTYYGDTSTTGNSAFTMVDGISIYGGFAGNEPADYDLSLRDITTNAAILDGRGQRRVVYQGADFTNSTTLSGFIVTQGYLNSGQGAGLRLQGNTRVEYCTISNNTASTNSNSKYGIGVYAYSNNSNIPVVIDHCTIKDNGALSGSYNYGILYLRNANVSNSLITGNQIYYRTIYSYAGNNQLVNSLIYGNSAQYYAGIYNYYASLQVTNCDIVSNTASNSSTPIYTYYSNYVTINNTVVWGNQAAGTPSYFTDYDNYILHNCAFDGVVNSIASVISLADSNDGTIDTLHYPRFVSPSEGDFTLMTGSALIDAGDSTYTVLSTDLDGNPRINFEQVDIGCYENNAIETCPRVLHLAVSSVGYNSAYITFQHGGNDTPSAYQIELSTPDTSWYYYGSTTQEHLFLANLDTNQHYNVRVRSVCDDTLFGLYSRTVGFQTRNQGDCSPLIVGTTETTDEGWCLPTNTCYSQSYTQQIFTVDEMESDTRTIDTIGFQYVYPNADTRILDIYLAHTSQSSLSSFLPSSGFELVFSGSVNFSNTGVDYWCNIPLQASFEYDGTSNLMVVIVDHTESHVYCDNGLFRTHSTNGNMARYAYTNSSTAYSPSNPPSGTSTSYRTNIRFSGMCQSENVACPLPNIVVRNVTSNSVEVEWVANSQYNLQIRNVTTGSDFATLTLNNAGTLTGLAQNTTYQIRIRNICTSTSEVGDWRTVRFTTRPSSSPIVYVTEQPRGIADGSSWDNATNDINFAQSVAISRGITFGTPASVWVAAGTYYGDTTSVSAFTALESVNVYGGFAGNEHETYDLTQRDFSTNPTILDGQNQRRVLYQHSSFSTRTIWDGFTITRGYVPYTGNYTYGHGAYLRGGFTIRNSKINDNATIYDGTYQYGGGIYTTNANTNNGVIIDHCDFFENGYFNGNESYVYGAAIYAYTYTTVISTRIHHNKSREGALKTSNGQIYIYNTLIDHNRSSYNGAGVNVSTTTYLNNTTITNNEIIPRSGNSYSGGGIYSNTSALYLRNSAIWGNKGISTASTDNIAGSYSVSNFNHCAIEGMSTDNVLALESENFGSDSLNYPAFVNPEEGNYRLHNSSALINGGTSTGYPMAPYISTEMVSFDLSDMTRTYDNAIDIGAYEYHGEEFCLTPTNVEVSQVMENSAYLSFSSRNGQSPLAYEIDLKTDSSDWMPYTSTQRNHLFLSNLIPLTNYTVRIRAVCDSLNDVSQYIMAHFTTTGNQSDCESVTITDDQQLTSSGNVLPINTWYCYSYTQQLFTAEELGFRPRNIDTISFQYHYSSAENRNISLYLAHTSNNTLSDYLPSVDFELVYSGTYYFSNTGNNYWCTIVLQSPFEYNGTDNLLVVMVDNTGSYTYNGEKFYTHSTSGTCKAIYNYRDSGPYSIGAPPTPNMSTYRNNIRIGGYCTDVGSSTCDRPNVSIIQVADHSAKVDLLTSDNYEIQLRKYGQYEYLPVYLESDSTIGNLEQNTYYQLRVRNICALGDTSDWRTIRFSTKPSESPVVYVAQQAVGLADGSSWDNAMSDINRAMDYAVARGNVYGTPAQVWVATGIYLGDTSTTGNSAFTMRAGVSVYGGFAGDEPANYDLSQRDLITNVTILDGRNQRRVLYQPSAFTAATNVIWDGFTIQNGQTSNSGAGAYLRAYSTLRNSIVKNNYSNGNSGGGVYAYGTSYNYYDDYGNFRSGYTPTIERCKLINNRGSNGGGAYLSYATLNNCLVANNTTTNYGGGIYANNTSLINSSTVVANDASSYGGVYCNNNSTLSNSIVWNNTSTNSKQLFNVNLHYSAVQEAISDTSSIVLANFNTGSFNSPRFIAPIEGTGYAYSGGNWQLADSSICIGRGSNAYVTDTLDLVNNARIQQGSVDMGCYESPYSSVQLPTYLDSIVYVVDGGAGLMDGTSWQNAMPNLQDAINVASTHRFPVWVAEGTFYGNLAQPNAFVAVDGVDVYGGFVGDEPANYDISQRDLTAHPTILDGQNLQRVLYQPTNFNTLTTWDGFTIQNGRLTSGNGAGVFIYGNFKVSNCIVRNNTTLSGNGAGVYKDNNNSTRSYVSNTRILDNVSSGSGGGLYAYYTTVTNCRLGGNSSGYGAGVYAYYGNYFYNCIIDHNSVSSYPGYGAVYSYNSNTFENCNVVNNTNTYSSTSGTGGVYASYSGSTFNNCIVWGNKRGYYVNNTQGTFTANSCAIEGGFSNGTNIINLASSNDGIDPTAFYVRFIDPDNGDYHLHATSPLIDAGDSTFVTQPIDYEGNARKYGGSVDIGAFESSEVNACPSVIGLHATNVTSSSARLVWADTNNRRYLVQYGLQGGSTIDTVSTIDTFITITGLALNRTYSVKIRAICDSGAMSFFSIPVNFTTQCDSSLLLPLSDFGGLNPVDSTIIYNQVVSFSWPIISNATSYDIYIWRANATEPNTPTVSGLVTPGLSNYTLPSYNYGVEYKWKVVAWNECISKVSPVMTLRANDLPNLHVSQVTNSTPVANQTMTVQWTVVNDGVGNTPPSASWNDYVWVTGHSGVGGGFLYNVDEVLLATIPHLQSLNSGESYTNSVQVSLPQDYIGNFFLFVLSDQYSANNIDFSPTGSEIAPIPYLPSITGSPYPYLSSQTTFIHSQMTESNESDNFFYKVINILPPPTPDLIVSHISHPTNTFSGHDLTIQWTVTNQGDATAIGAWSDAVYIQQGNNVAPNLAQAHLLGTYPHGRDTLLSSETYTNSAVVTIPIDYMGDYTIFVVTDVSDDLYESIYEHNNTTASIQTLNVTITPPSDLVVSAATYPIVMDIRGNYSISYTVSNNGSSATHTPRWKDAIYLSQRPQLDDSATLLSLLQHNAVLEPDSSYTQNTSVTIPNNITGNWYLFVKTDVNNDVFEYTYEDNNIYRSDTSVSIRVPDLSVQSITLSSNHISPGETFNLSYRVKNIGDGSLVNTTWRDAIYLTSSPVFNRNNAIQLHSSRNTLVLLADSSYTCTFSLTLPSNTTGDRYIWVVADDQNNVFENSLEDNNILRYSDTLYTLLPDLTVTSVVIPDSVERGGTMRVRWMVKNLGPGDVISRTFKDEIRWGAETIFESSLSNYTLSSGDSIVRNSVVNVPCNASNQGVVSVVTDVDNQIPENGATTNNAKSVNVGTLLSADLAVELLTPTDTLWSGSTIPLKWILTNQGNASIVNTAIVDKIYLSQSAVVYNAFDSVGHYSHSLNLPVGGVDTINGQFTLPNGIQGNYYLHVVTNTAGSLCESSTTNNVAHSTVVPVLLSPWPDLTVSNILAPSEVNIGEVITVQYNVSNMGIAPLENHSVTNNIYYSSSASSYNPSNLLTAHTCQLNLDVGDTANLSTSFVVPTTLSAGNYYLYVVADATNSIYEHTGENNNTAHSSAIRVKLYPLDLMAYDIQGSNTVEWAEQVRQCFVVKNNSGVPTLSSVWMDVVYLSSDPVLHSTDMRLHVSEHRTQLLPDSTYRIDFTFTVPLGTPPTAYLIAVTDENSNNPDVNLSNNVYTKQLSVNSIPTADLAVSEFDILTDTIVSGQTARASYKVTNVGPVPLSPSRWTDKVFLSSDISLDGADAEIGSLLQNRDTLAPNQYYYDTIEFTVPLPTAGNVSLILKANAGNTVYESNTNNNLDLASVTVLLPLPGDWVVDNIDAPDSVVSGSSLHIAWEVRNIGENTLSGSGLRSLVYLSSDTLFDPADKLLGMAESNNIRISQNQSVQQQLSARVSGVPEERYYVIVKTDVRNAFNELHRENNTAYSEFAVQVVMRTLEFNTPTADTLLNNQVSDFRLNVGTHRNETVRIHISSNDSLNGAVNMIYVSHNGVGDNLHYDYSTLGQYTGNPELFIPATIPQYYGINVYGSTPMGSAQPVVISADIIPFELRSVSPIMGGNTGKVTLELTGSRFRPDMQVWMAGMTDTLFPDTIIYVNYYKSFATFNLAGKDTGMYDVGVLNHCEGEAVLADAFRVIPGVPDNLGFNLIFPASPRPNRNIVMTLEFGNIGNVDIIGAVLEVSSVGGAWISLTPEGLQDHLTTILVPLTIDGEPEGLLRPGQQSTIPIYGFTAGTLIMTIERNR